MNVIKELHRRRVFATVLIYMTVSVFFVISLEVITSAAGVDPRVIDYAAIALVGALPVIVAFAWMFDLTSKGVEHTSSKQVKLEWKHFGLPLLAAILLLFISLAFYSLNETDRELNKTPAGAIRK